MGSYSRRTLNILEGFTKEDKPAYKLLHIPNSSNIFNFGNPLHSIQPSIIESKSIANTFIFNDNPSLCEGLGESGITGSHGVVKCALPRTLEKKGAVSWSPECDIKARELVSVVSCSCYLIVLLVPTEDAYCCYCLTVLLLNFDSF